MHIDIQLYFDIWKLVDFHIIMTLLFFIAAWRWGDWRNWGSYYPTFLFFILNDFGYNFLTYNQPLWQYKSPLLGTTIVDIIITLVGYPSIILLFLTYYPKGIYKQLGYIFAWGTLYSLVMEYVSYKLGFLSYYNGWNLYYAFGFVYTLFPMFRLHHKNPFWAWIVASTMAVVTFLWFGLSFERMK